MKLIIREYLSLLKESKELDWLIPNLLLSMGIEPVSYPQIGVRQYGVDVAAVGADKNSIKWLYLFTIKQGDIGRSDWDGNNQAVRPSLDEILDVYIKSHIPIEYNNLPIKIVVCTGGVLKQDIQQNWASYVDRNSVENNREYEFWGGDKLSILIEKYMFNEQIVPDEFQSKLRRTLALLGDSDYDLKDFDTILKKILIEDEGRKLNLKKAKKKLYTVHLCLNIIWYWSRSENNIKPTMQAADSLLLYVWEFIRVKKLSSNIGIVTIFNGMVKTFLEIYREYFCKVKKLCYIEESLSMNESYYLLNCLNVFDVLSNISIYGLTLHYCSEKDSDCSEMQEVVEALKHYIPNHLALCSPCYDEHIIDISLAILLLHEYKETELVDWWIFQIIEHLRVAYLNQGKYFPIQSDSFDDLVALNESNRIEKERLFELSTLIPILAQWCLVLNLKQNYNHIYETAEKFSSCSLQIWYPDKSVEDYLYTCNAGYKSGAVDAPIKLLKSMDEMIQEVLAVQKNTITFNELSSVKKGYKFIPLISSKHYRTPLLPIYWQSIILDKDEL